MNYQLIETEKQPYLEGLPGDGQLDSERAALDLVAACGENGASRLLLHADSFTDDFFHLRTGLAGTVLQKFSQYRVRVAAVLTPELVNQGRFKEMVLEANRGSQFRVFYDTQAAIQWLVE